MSEPPRGSSPRDEFSRFDDHLRYISTALFGAGMVAVLLVANLDLVLPHTINRVALNLIVAAAGLSIAGIMLFPWRRYHHNLFLVAILDGLCLIALAIYFSGGWESPFFVFYFFVVVFYAIYFSPLLTALLVLLTFLISLSPQLYAPEASQLLEHVVVQVPTYLALAFVSWYMAREVGRREHLRGEYERRLQEMRELKDHLQREASTDRLTNLPNRSHFESRLREEIERARGWNGQFTVIFLDVDDFKRINDVYGHPTGDASLKLIADALRSNVRQTDAVARQGVMSSPCCWSAPHFQRPKTSLAGSGRRWQSALSKSWAFALASARERPPSPPTSVTPTVCSEPPIQRCTRRNVGGRISFTTVSWTPDERARSEKVAAPKPKADWVSNPSRKGS